MINGARCQGGCEEVPSGCCLPVYFYLDAIVIQPRALWPVPCVSFPHLENRSVNYVFSETHSE